MCNRNFIDTLETHKESSLSTTIIYKKTAQRQCVWGNSLLFDTILYSPEHEQYILLHNVSPFLAVSTAWGKLRMFFFSSGLTQGMFPLWKIVMLHSVFPLRLQVSPLSVKSKPKVNIYYWTVMSYSNEHEWACHINATLVVRNVSNA